jgi:hypothetical protein
LVFQFYLLSWIIFIFKIKLQPKEEKKKNFFYYNFTQ